MRKILFAVLFVALAASVLVPQTVNMGRTYTASLNVRYANEGVTGTTVNKLAKLTGAPSTAIIAAITDTSGVVGVVVGGAGTTGNAVIAFKGKASCDFDSATTAGDYVTIDTSTAGDCMDVGAAYPTSGQVIGIVTSTNGGAGTYEVDLTLGQPQAAAGSGNVYIEYIAAVCQNATATAGFSTPAAGAPTAACVTGANTNYGVLQFTDASAQAAQQHFRLPPTWTGTVDLLVKWRSAAIAGDVVWQVQTICVADGETGDPAFNAASIVIDTAKGTTLQWNDATITGVTMTGCAAGEEMLFRFFRDPAHASDDLGATAEMIQITWKVSRTL